MASAESICGTFPITRPLLPSNSSISLERILFCHRLLNSDKYMQKCRLQCWQLIKLKIVGRKKHEVKGQSSITYAPLYRDIAIFLFQHNFICNGSDTRGHGGGAGVGGEITCKFHLRSRQAGRSKKLAGCGWACSPATHFSCYFQLFWPISQQTSLLFF